MGVCAVVAAWAPGPDAIAAPSWGDFEARIEYAFHTEDARDLRVAAATATESDAPLGAYFGALAEWRASRVLAPRDRKAAAAAAGRCARHADVAAKDAGLAAESLALRAVCLAVVAHLKSWKAPLAESRSGTQIAEALRLAPRNPRVLLLDALADYELPKRRGEALPKLQRVVKLFEAERQDVTPLPGWGAAEAYAALGRSLLDAGDAIAARAALEKSLLLAPEFGFARRLMARITNGG